MVSPGFLTAMRQEVTRAHKGWALDGVVLYNGVTPKFKEDITTAPAGMSFVVKCFHQQNQSYHNVCYIKKFRYKTANIFSSSDQNLYLKYTIIVTSIEQTSSSNLSIFITHNFLSLLVGIKRSIKSRDCSKRHGHVCEFALHLCQDQHIV